MKYAVATKKISNYYDPNNSKYGIDSLYEIEVPVVSIVEADSAIKAINQVLPGCPLFDETNDIEKVVNWLNSHGTFVSVPQKV